LSSGSRSSALNSSLARRSSTPSPSATTVALRFASDTSASSPKASPPLSSASTTLAPPTSRSTWKRPDSTT
jgi:hypothetical protein